jgi:PAS domain S-box-containing protein
VTDWKASQSWRVLALVSVLAAVALAAAAVAITALYQTAVDVERERLVESARSQARWIESMARFETMNSLRDRAEVEERTLAQFFNAHEGYEVFGRSSETVLARREGDVIRFLMRHAGSVSETAGEMPFADPRAEPMHRALEGLSGSMIGHDYDGVMVLAAYEPVDVLDLGIVTKVDMSELRVPFIRAALLTVLISLGLVAAGAWLLVEISQPMIRSLEEQARRLERTVAALRDSEERFRHTFEQAAIGVAHVTPDGTFLRVNRRFAEMTGYTPEDLLSMKAEQLAHPDDRSAAAANVRHLVDGDEESFTSERRFLRKDGTVIWVDNTVSLLRDENGAPRYLIAMVSEATGRKRSEAAMRALLNEKDVLLREIHHRVKNNMQVVSSLLSLQALGLEDEKLRRVFQESQSRVRAMALIHETLYESEDLSRIALGPYISRVGDGLIGMYGAPKGRVELAVAAGEIALNIDDTVPCGLIINELLSNSLKYAFPDGRTGQVQIEATSSADGEITLEVRDDGVGIPEEIDIRRTTTMGMRLVTGLVENQLGGTIDVDRSSGTAFRIRFHRGGFRAGGSP